DEDLYTFEGGFELDEEDRGSAIAFAPGQDSLIQAINESLQEIDEQGLIEDYLAQAGEYMLTEEVDADGEVIEQSFASSYWKYFWDGTLVTLLISGVSVFFGLILGTLLALMRLSNNVV